MNFANSQHWLAYFTRIFTVMLSQVVSMEYVPEGAERTLPPPAPTQPKKKPPESSLKVDLALLDYQFVKVLLLNV
jgi:uncharacterized membrane protein YagU involved in acid resistance